MCAFQSCAAWIWGHKAGLPGFVTQKGGPKYADYGHYIVNHERKARQLAFGRLASPATKVDPWTRTAQRGANFDAYIRKWRIFR